MACSRGAAAPDAQTQRRLFAASAGYCQNPSCANELFVDVAGKSIHIAEMAHVFASDGGPRAQRRIDYLAAYRELFADVGALRESALNSDGSIRAPMVLDRSIKRRMSLIAQSLKLSQQIHTVRNVQLFMDTIMNEIASESPELQRRLLARLRQLHAAADPGR